MYFNTDAERIAALARRALAQRGIIPLLGRDDDAAESLRPEAQYVVDMLSWRDPWHRPLLAGYAAALMTYILSVNEETPHDFGRLQVVAWTRFVADWLDRHECSDARWEDVKFLRRIAWQEENGQPIAKNLLLEADRRLRETQRALTPICRLDRIALSNHLVATGAARNGFGCSMSYHAFTLVWIVMHPKAKAYFQNVAFGIAG